MPEDKKSVRDFQLVDISSYKHEQTMSLIEDIQGMIEDLQIKGMVAIIVPSKGRPMLLTNLTAEEGFMQTHRAMGVFSAIISAQEEAEEELDDECDE